MSTENSSNAAPEEAVNDATENTEEVKDPKAVLKKNRELLAQMADTKKKLAEYQEKLDLIEQDQLAQAGKKDELIENLKKQVREREERLKTTTQTFALKSVNQQMLDAARAKGCENPDLVLRLADLSSVPVSDDFTVDTDALDAVLESVKEEAPMLFAKKAPAAPRDGTPTTTNLGPKPLSQMSAQELADLYTKAAQGGQ